MHLRGLIGFLLLASPALAQTLALTVNGSADAVLNSESCGGTLEIGWTAVPAGTPSCGQLRLWVTSGSCGEAPASSDVSVGDDVDWINNQTGTESFAVNSLPVFTADAGCGTAIEKTNKVCGAFKHQVSGGSCTAITAQSPPKIIYDAVAPAPPVLKEVISVDSELTAVVEFPDDANFIDVLIRVATNPDGGTPGAFVKQGEATPERTSVSIQNLTNGVTYDVVAQALDRANNKSGDSNIVKGTPVRTQGYCEISGACDQVGCGVVGGAFGVWLIVGGWLISRRRNR